MLRDATQIINLYLVSVGPLIAPHLAPLNRFHTTCGSRIRRHHVPSLSHRITGVALRGVLSQVAWIDAGAIVAAMADEQIARIFAAIL